jgi:hypothetical protein
MLASLRDQASGDPERISLLHLHSEHSNPANQPVKRYLRRLEDKRLVSRLATHSGEVPDVSLDSADLAFFALLVKKTQVEDRHFHSLPLFAATVLTLIGA